VDESIPDGPGVLLFRHESVGITAGHLLPPTGNRLRGSITAISRTGLRRRATVRVNAEDIQAELPATLDVIVGDPLTLDLARGILCVVSEASQ